VVTEVCNPRSMRRETYGYLPSRRTSHYNAAVLRPSKNHSCCCVQVRRQIRCTILVLSFTRLASQCTCCFCIPHVPNSFCRHVLLFDAKIKKTIAKFCPPRKLQLVTLDAENRPEMCILEAWRRAQDLRGQMAFVFQYSDLAVSTVEASTGCLNVSRQRLRMEVIK